MFAPRAQYFVAHLGFPPGGTPTHHLHDSRYISSDVLLDYVLPEMRRAPTSQSLLLVPKVNNLGGPPPLNQKLLWGFHPSSIAVAAQIENAPWGHRAIFSFVFCSFHFTSPFFNLVWPDSHKAATIWAPGIFTILYESDACPLCYRRLPRPSRYRNIFRPYGGEGGFRVCLLCPPLLLLTPP